MKKHNCHLLTQIEIFERHIYALPTGMGFVGPGHGRRTSTDGGYSNRFLPDDFAPLNQMRRRVR